MLKQLHIGNEIEIFGMDGCSLKVKASFEMIKEITHIYMYERRINLFNCGVLRGQDLCRIGCY